jgi:beta-lactamase regulating signal transducer with metallopeptidase domain
MRMLPAIGSCSLVLGVIVPAFWFFEPQATAERAGPTLVIFVILAGALVAAGLYRTLASWLDTRHLEREWSRAAVLSANLGTDVPTYRVHSAMPLAALVGIVRPRLYVADQFLDALSADERQAVLEHEAGHLLSLDNLRRTVMRLAPDWLSFLPAGREIETAWAIAAEEGADDHAAGVDRSRSLDLAAALLKASRLTPMPPAPVSAFCDQAPIARRVARLLKDQPARRRPARPTASRFAWILALAGIAVLPAGPVLRAAYTLTEAAVRLLQ